MNKVYLFFLVFISSLSAFSQTTLPSSFNVQFSLRRANGAPAANKPADINIRLLNNTGNAVYKKIISQTANAFGIFNIVVEGLGSGNVPFPNAETFASGNLKLEIQVDTTLSPPTFFTIYNAQSFASVPYSMAAQKAPGTFEYQYDDSEAGDIAKGINKDVLFQNDTLDANFFPRLFFNKKNNVWSSTEKSYSLLPNNLSAINRTIFFNVTPNPNLKPRWEINQALSMSNTGIGINLPGGAAPNSALEVIGNVRFPNLNASGSNRMVVVDAFGNLSSQIIPSGSGPTLPLGINQGDMLFYDINGAGNWATTSNIKYLGNSFYAANSIFAGDSLSASNAIINNNTFVGNSLFLNNIKNNSPTDTFRFLSTNTTGKVVLRRAANFVWSLKGNDLNTLPGSPYLGTSDASDLVFKTDALEAMRIYGTALTPNRKKGDVEIDSSLYVSNDLNVSAKVNFLNANLNNLLPADSNQFLTTNSNGNVVLRKIKFPPNVGGGASKWSFVQTDYLTPSIINKGLLIATIDTFSAARIINKTTMGAMQLLNGEVFQGKIAPTLTVTNRLKQIISLINPIGIKVDMEDSSNAIGISINGGKLFNSINTAGIGIRSSGTIGIRGIGESRNLIGPSIGAHLSAGANPLASNLLSVGLLADGQNGASGLIVREGNSGFGIKYTGQVFSPIPNSTVEINGTFGQSAKYYNFPNGPTSITVMPDTSNYYIVATANVDFTLPLPINFPNREYTFYVYKPSPGNYTFSLNIPGFPSYILDFRTQNTSSTYNYNVNKSAKIKAVSVFFGGFYKWIVTASELD
jgi:hypothetical protein